MSGAPTWIVEFVASSEWTVAKSGDHAYAVKGKTAPDVDAFEALVDHIHHNGYSEVFAGRFYRYYEPGDGWRYWSQGLAPQATTIINRAAAGRSADEKGALNPTPSSGHLSTVGQLRLSTGS